MRRSPGFPMIDDSANKFRLAETGLRHSRGGGSWSLLPSLGQRLPDNQVQAAHLGASLGVPVTYRLEWPS